MSGHFLVVADFPLFARDLSVTLEQMGLGSPLIAASDIQALEVLSRRDKVAPLPLAVLQIPPEKYERSSLRAMLDASGTRVVLVESEGDAEATRCPYPLLRKPVFREDLEGVVRQLMG